MRSGLPGSGGFRTVKAIVFAGVQDQERAAAGTGIVCAPHRSDGGGHAKPGQATDEGELSTILTDKIAGPAAWRGADIEHTADWCVRLSADDRAELDAALAHIKRAQLEFPAFEKGDFPLPTLSARLQHVADFLESGFGFMLIRGVPVQDYSEADIRILYYGLGLHLGAPVPQNPAGDLLGTVMNVGNAQDKNTRVYQTNAYLPYHTDPSDVVGLLCLKQARVGGLSSLVSVASVYNRMLDECPEYLGLFYRQVYYAHMGEDLPSLTPLFSYYDGKFTCRYLRQYIELGHEIMGLPLSQVEQEALDYFDAIAREPTLRLDMMLEPGDLQFANNYMILHSRTGFEDYDEVDQRRHMLRLWLKMPNARRLAPDFPGRNGFAK